VHRNDGPGARRDGGLDLARIHLECGCIRIYKNRQGVLAQYHVDRGDKCVGRNQDLVAWLDSKRVQAGEQGAGAVRRRQTVLGAGQLGIGPFEICDRLAVSAIPLSAVQRIEKRTFLRLVENRPGWKSRRMSLGAAQQRGLNGRPAGSETESRSRHWRGGQETSSR